MNHLAKDDLEAGLDEIGRSPKDEGVLELIVRRPAVDEREVINEGELDTEVGLVGDTWNVRGSSRTPDDTPHPGMQINIMNSRVIDLIAQEKERWPLAGDQLFVDMDLSAENLPIGTRLALGSAILEVTEQPHTGCNKFRTRFGADALKFVNSTHGRNIRLRGLNAKVIQPGTIRTGDTAKKTS